MPLHHYLQILRKRWITVVVVTFLCVLAAGIVSALTPATYAAHATSFVSLTDAGGASTSIAQSSQFAQSRVESYPEVVHSPEVLQPVIDDLRLDMTVQELDRKVTAVNPTNTVNLTVTATDHDPKLAGEIANGVADNMALVIPELEKPANGQATPVKVTVIRPAETPQYPVSPRKTLNLVLGFVVGLALGIVAALIREATDTTVRSGAELYDLTGLERPRIGALRLVVPDPAARRHAAARLRRGGLPDDPDDPAVRQRRRTTAPDRGEQRDRVRGQVVHRREPRHHHGPGRPLRVPRRGRPPASACGRLPGPRRIARGSATSSPGTTHSTTPWSSGTAASSRCSRPARRPPIPVSCWAPTRWRRCSPSSGAASTG